MLKAGRRKHEVERLPCVAYDMYSAGKHGLHLDPWLYLCQMMSSHRLLFGNFPERERNIAKKTYFPLGLFNFFLGAQRVKFVFPLSLSPTPSLPLPLPNCWLWDFHPSSSPSLSCNPTLMFPSFMDPSLTQSYCYP